MSSQIRNSMRGFLLILTFFFAISGGVARAGDAQGFKFTNSTGKPAKDLHITFTGSGGNLKVLDAVVIVDGSSSKSTATEQVSSPTVTMDWGASPVPAGSTVQLLVSTTAGPLSIQSVYWSGIDGATGGPGGPGTVTIPPADQSQFAPLGSIPISTGVKKLGEDPAVTPIGKIHIIIYNDKIPIVGTDGHRITAVFDLAPEFAFLDNWYDFKWVTVLTQKLADGVSQQTDKFIGKIPGIDPQPTVVPPPGEPGTGDDNKPFDSSDIDEPNFKKEGHSVTSTMNPYEILESATKVEFIYTTYLVATNVTDPMGMGPNEFCVLGGFMWKYTRQIINGDDQHHSTTYMGPLPAPEAGVITTALGNTNFPPPGGPNTPGWKAIVGCTFSECEAPAKIPPCIPDPNIYNIATGSATGIWSSMGFGTFAWPVGTGFPAGTGGNSMWAVLPPELTAYFECNNGGPYLRFRGVEFEVGTFNISAPAFDSPNIEIRDAAPNPNNLARRVPGAELFATFPSTPNSVQGGLGYGAAYRLCYDFGPGNSAPVKSLGRGLSFVWKDYDKQYGDGNGILLVSTANEPTGTGADSISYSGATTPSGQHYILPTFTYQGQPVSGEFVVTWLFDQSMIQAVKNARVMASNEQILGGGSPPSPYTIQFEDGRASIYINPGDAVSFNCNSRLGTFDSGGVSSVWCAPMVQLSSDLGSPGATDPLPENWYSGPVTVHAMSLQQFIDDLLFLFGSPPGTGAALNPNDSTLALWLGIDLPDFLNYTILSNGLAFADVSSGPQWSGPMVEMYDSASNSSAPIGRNLANVAGYYDNLGQYISGIREYRTLWGPGQSGYTPIVAAPSSSTMLGFGVYNGGMTGATFSIQCWMLDMQTSKILDVTNVAVVHLN
ncbi:MAG: hypothetical protein HY286_00415 [Planctomycetes bacterium]|nr:hypothetical protein [Planctomycetota bacterium]